MKKWRIILVFFLLVNSTSVLSQSFGFTDKFGNEFKITCADELPKGMSVEYLSKNLDGKHFNYKESDSVKFRYTVLEIKKIHKNNFEMKVSVFPVTDSMEIRMRYSFGPFHYLLTTVKRGRSREIDTIKFISAEI